jgi:hypothetical protein
VIISFEEKKTKTTMYIYVFLADDLELEYLTTPDAVNIEPSYRGPHIDKPIHKGHFEALILAFQRGEV